MKYWEPELPFLIDLLSIVNLKSVILGANNEVKKKRYEEEATELEALIDKKMKKVKVKDYGKLIRAIQVNMLANRLIWENETKAREGGRSQDHLLPFTHAVNGMRTRAGNAMVNQTGGKVDMNLDRVDEKLCESYGFNFRGLL